jgi:TldD protein
VGTQAADGMHLDRSYGSNGVSLADLDSAEAFNKHASSLIARSPDLRKAPLVDEEYHGPVLLSADAGIGRHSRPAGLRGDRHSAGDWAPRRAPRAVCLQLSCARAAGVSGCVDDPSLKTLKGKSLVGAYKMDDEGVPAQTVKLIATASWRTTSSAASRCAIFPSRTATAGQRSPARAAGHQRAQCERA